MLNAIAAVAENRVIGCDGGLPWRLPDDLKWFKRTTLGHPVITGRKNLEATGAGGGGVLPGRRNIVLSRQRGYRCEGAEVVHSLEEALKRVEGDAEVFVIGGEEVYRSAMPRVDRLYLTHVHAEPRGDTYFPAVDMSQWQSKTLEHHPADDRHAHAFTIVQYARKNPTPPPSSRSTPGQLLPRGLLLALLLAVFTTACDLESDPPPALQPSTAAATRPAAQGPTAPPAVDPRITRGKEAFAEYGCYTCHYEAPPEDPGDLELATGPPLYGIYGEEVSLKTGDIVVRDEAYLEESITDPQAQEVGGYYTTMQPFRDVDPWDVEPLVEYIKSLTPVKGEGAES